MIQLVIGLALLGFILWLVLTYIPMPDAIKTTIIVIVVVCIVLYVAGLMGFTDLPLPSRHR